MVPLKKITSLVACLSLFCVASVAQTPSANLPKIIPPSPDASSLGKFGDVPVGYYTGLPTVSIPLYNIQSRDLSVPISLSYHAAGIRVEEEASWVGLGWALTAGGTVSRTVRGNDDLNSGVSEQGFVYCAPFPAKGYVPNSNPPAYTFPSNFIMQACMGGIDTQPDIFSFSFLNYSGKFYLRKKSTPGSPVAVMLSSNNEKMSISYDEVLKKWTILTKEGIKAIFGTKELTNTLSGEVLDPNNPPSPLGWEPKDDIITSWYLDKLFSPTGEEITFTYYTPPNNSQPVASRGVMSISETRSRLVALESLPESPSTPKTLFGKFFNKVFNLDMTSADPGTQQGSPCTNTGSSYSGSVGITWNVYLRSIQFTNGEVLFHTSERQDIQEHFTSTVTFSKPRKLDEIEVFSQGVSIKRIIFQQSYYNQNTVSSPFLNKRLKLDAVYEANGTASKPPHVFSYFGQGPTGTFLPAKNSAARDHWGLYNAAEGNNYANNNKPSFVPQFSYAAQSGTVFSVPGADREPNEEASKVGILTKIQYPTGGATEFFYESHQVTVDESVELPYNQDYFINVNSLSGNSQVFEVQGLTGASITATLKCSTLSCYPGGANQPCDLPTSLYSTPYLSITNLGTGEIVFTARYSDFICKSVANTPCEEGVRTNYCGITRTRELTLSAGRYLVRATSQSGFLAEGVVSYKARRPANTITNQRTYKGGGLRIQRIVDHDGVSSGNDLVRRFYYTTEMPIFQSNGSVVSSGKLMSIPKYHTFEYNNVSTGGSVTQCVVIKSSSYSNTPLGSSARGSAVGYDKVIVSAGDHAENGFTVYTFMNDPDEEVSPFLPNAPTVTHEASNGLLKTETHFSNNRFKVKETTNFYASVIDTNPIEAVYTYSTNGCGNGGNGITGFQEYKENSEWWYLSETVENFFDESDMSNQSHLTKSTRYFYDNLEHRQLTRSAVIGSDGREIVTQTYYPLDLPAVAPAEMWDQTNVNYKHMHGAIIKQEVHEVEPSSLFISGVTQQYEFQADKGKVLQKRTDVAKTNGVYESRVSFERYDSKGNVLQVRKTNDVSIAYLWGYNQTLPVAQAINANWDQIYYEGFETHAQATSGSAMAHSGLKFKETSFTVTFSPPAGQYELSYWNFTSGSWTQVKQPYTAGLTLTGDRLDDIRIYPVGAQMTTYDYDPLVGTITVTDFNNMPTFYNYDELQRLVSVKDFESHILKAFRYNYKN